MTEDDVAKLYRAYGYFVFRRCVAYLGDPEAAGAALQEVFVRAFRETHVVRDDAHPREWLCRIADQLCVALVRRRKRTLAHSETPLSEPPEAAIADAISHDDLESLLTIRKLLADLDPEFQRLAVLYYVDELTHEEIAAELGMSRRAVDGHLRRLLAHERSVLREEKAS